MIDFNLILNEKSFKLVFGLKLFRILGRKWDLPGLMEVIEKIKFLENAEGKENLSFETMDLLEDLIISAIEAGNNPDFNPDECSVLDEFFNDPNAMQQLVDNITMSMPRSQPAVDSGKEKAAPKGKKNP